MATKQNGHRPKWPQTKTVTNRMATNYLNTYCVETWKNWRNPKSSSFSSLFKFILANCIQVFNFICTTVVAIVGKEINYCHLLVYPKEYAHSFIRFVMFILRIHIALTWSIYPYFPGLITLPCDNHVIVEWAVKPSLRIWVNLIIRWHKTTQQSTKYP